MRASPRHGTSNRAGSANGGRPRRPQPKTGPSRRRGVNDVVSKVYADRRSRSVTILDRPFYFVVVLWGQRFRDYFLDYCLPSLLSPGNFPSLSTSAPSTLVIATQPGDWAAMKTTAIFQELERYVVPVMAELPAYVSTSNVYEHMG